MSKLLYGILWLFFHGGIFYVYWIPIKKEDIKSLTFYSSESCNLNCSYCHLAKNNINHQNENSLIKESLKNGNYLNNFKIALKKLNINPKGIEAIELWGQEPTLTLDEFTLNIKELFNYFPNFNKLSFSTNFVSHQDKIINLLKTIDENNLIYNRKFTVDLQISFDGLNETSMYRGVSGEKIYNNLTDFYKELNLILFKSNLTLQIHYHNVITRKLMKEKNTLNLIKQYWDHLDEIALNLFKINNNKKVRAPIQFSPGIENPVQDASTEDGITFFNFLKMSSMVNSQTNTYIGLIEQHLSNIHNKIRSLNADSLYEIIEKIKELKDEEFFDKLSFGMFCGQSYGCLKMRYDGTLVHCQNALFNLKENDFIDKNLSMEDYVRKSQIPYNINILTSSNDEINKYFYKMKISHEHAFPILFIQSLNLIFDLALVGQVDKNYLKDLDKLYRHAFYITLIMSCIDNNLISNGSVFGKNIGDIRFYCNGFLDLLDLKLKI